MHPRMLVGKEVPSMTGEGMEKLKSSEDARDWQDAVKEILVQEIEGQTGQWVQDSVGFMETIHSSVDLFRNNTDLIPGTKGFNRQLADRFAKMAQPYEVRHGGKLHGYSIPVQPIIEDLRRQMQATGKAPTKKTGKRPAAPPQRGIPSKAPSSSEREDFSTLFGTIGLPHLKI